jgi:hypothetical protein
MEHLCEAGRCRAGRRLHALRARQLADGRHPRDRARTGCACRRLGLPQVVVPGCVDFFNQGAPGHRAGALPLGRKSYFHNPVATLVRLDRDEEARLGALSPTAQRGRGPVRVVAPARGFSLADAEGGDLWDPVADGAFLDALRGALRPTSRSRPSTPTSTTTSSPTRRRALPALVRRPSMPDSAPSPLPARPRAAGHRLVPGALGHRPGPDRLLRAARRAPAARHGHDHRAGGRAARRAKADVPVHAPFWPATRRSTCARPSPRSARSRCARARSTRSSTTSALADPPRLEQADPGQRARLQHRGARPAAAPDQVRDRRAGGALQALRRALHRDPRRAAGEPSGRDARAGTPSELETSQVLAHDARMVHGWTAPRRPRAGRPRGCRSRS